MTSLRGIVAAGAIAGVVTGAHAAYQSWPATYGTEIEVPAALVRQQAGMPFVAVRLPFAQIALDVPHTAPPAGETYAPLPRLGDWWVSGGDKRAMARRLRGRPLYVQLDQGKGAGSVSDAVVSGATNLAGTVTSVREDGSLTLDFGFAPIAIPVSVPLDARATAVLRVLPSGRATLAGVIVNGMRY